MTNLKRNTLWTIGSYLCLLTGLAGCSYVQLEHGKKEEPINPVKFKLIKYTKDPHLAEVISKTTYPTQLAAIAKVESNFRPLIKGDGGDSFGLYQINSRWWGKTGETLEQQTEKAERLLDYYTRQYGATEALRRWCGSGKAAKIYQAKVLKEIKEIQSL